MTEEITFVVWGQGDQTVGDGTFHAELTLHVLPEHREVVKLELARMLSPLWDLDGKYIHVLCLEEYEAECAREARAETG